MSDCPICFDELRSNLCTTNPCGHLFHRECLARWERQSKRGGGRAANASAMKCPSCNKVTKGVIHIFVDFGSDVSSKSQSSSSSSNDHTKDLMLEKKVSGLKEQLRLKSNQIDDLQVQLSALPDIERQCNDLRVQLTDERIAKLKLTREYKKMEEVANKRIEDVNRKWNIRHACVQGQLKAAQDEIKALKPMQDDMRVVRYESQKIKRELQQVRSELEQKNMELNGIRLSRDENKTLLRDTKQKLAKYQLQGSSNDILENENKRLKRKLKEITKNLEESKSCIIEPRSGTKTLSKPNDQSLAKKILNPFQKVSNSVAVKYVPRQKTIVDSRTPKDLWKERYKLLQYCVALYISLVLTILFSFSFHIVRKSFA